MRDSRGITPAELLLALAVVAVMLMMLFPLLEQERKAVSYAELHYRSFVDEKGKPRAFGPDELHPQDAIASDDTDGEANHPDLSDSGGHVLSACAGVDWRTHSELDWEKAVGLKGGILERLRN